MPLTKRSLEKLRRRLPKGAVPVVVERLAEAGTPFTKQFVYMNLKGDRYNQTVILALIAYAEENEATELELNARASA